MSSHGISKTNILWKLKFEFISGYSDNWSVKFLSQRNLSIFVRDKTKNNFAYGIHDRFIV